MNTTLFEEIVSLENLEKAFENARKGKSSKQYVLDFEKNRKSNLSELHNELVSFSYTPKPLQTFILRDNLTIPQKSRA